MGDILCLFSACVLAALLLSACTPAVLSYAPVGPDSKPVWGQDDTFLARDKKELKFQVWRPRTEDAPKSIVIALHGFNDHKERFAKVAKTWSENGILVFAYDQRGFGKAAIEDNEDIWPRSEALINDLIDFTRLIGDQKDTGSAPIVLLGESMGGAVILAALAHEDMPNRVKRAVVVAPSVKGGAALNPFSRLGLALIAHIAPTFTLSTRGYILELSEDVKLTAAIINDPSARKSVRVDAVWGLVGLMDQAVTATQKVNKRVLVVYGGEDTLIPVSSVRRILEALPVKYSESCYRPFSGHLLFHETLERRGARPAVKPEPLWNGLRDWIITGRLPNLCK